MLEFPNHFGLTAFQGKVVQLVDEDVSVDRYVFEGGKYRLKKSTDRNREICVRLPNGSERTVKFYGDVIWRGRSNIVCYQAFKNGEPLTIGIGNLDTGEWALTPKVWTILSASTPLLLATGAFLLYTGFAVYPLLSGQMSETAPSAALSVIPAGIIALVLWSMWEKRRSTDKLTSPVIVHFKRTLSMKETVRELTDAGTVMTPFGAS